MKALAARALVAAAIALAAVVALAQHAVAETWLPGDDTARVTAFEGLREFQRYRATDPGPELRTVEYRRSAGCLYGPASSMPCPQYDPTRAPLLLTCEEGAPVAPLWRRERPAVGAQWREWSLRVEWSCPEDQVPAFTAADFRRLKIEPLLVNQQPAAGPVLVQRPTIVFTEPEDRELRAVLFDSFGVDVVVTPVEYEWDFGDGSTLTTTEPGRPYPAFDLTHVYTELADRQITLTTTWTGRYRVDADPLHRWRDVEGTATTVDVGDEFEVVSLRTRLTG